VSTSSTPAERGDGVLGVVDFSIFPHLGLVPESTMAVAEKWAAEIAGPAYAIDEQTAIKVTDGTVEVISEGHWKLFPQPWLAVIGAATGLAR
jgi:dipeptidase E